MKYVLGEEVISKLWIPVITLQLLMNATLAEADLHPQKSGVDPWIPNIFFANPYVVRYPLANRSVSSLANSKSAHGRTFGDSYLNGGSLDYTSYTDVLQDKAVPVNPNEPSIPAESVRPGSGTSGSAGYPLVSQQYQSYPSGGYYYSAPAYLPPTQLWPPSQSFNTFEFGGLYLPANGTGGLLANTRNQFVVQPHMCSNSIQVIRSSDVDIRTTYRSDSNQTYVCIIMLYGVNEYNKLAVSLDTKEVQQQVTNSTSTDAWLQAHIKMYSVQEANITLIDTKYNFGTNSSGLVLTKSNIVILSLDVDRAVDFLLYISTYQSATC